MAVPNIALVQALRKTAVRLEDGAAYKWSHFANCNCGNLAQTITNKPPAEIYRAAFRKTGDWGEQALEYCATTGLPMDYIIGQMMEVGLSRHDFRHLERLSDAKVLRRVGRRLRHTSREDTITYMRAWADLLEEALPEEARDAHALPMAAE